MSCFKNGQVIGLIVHTDKNQFKWKISDFRRLTNEKVDRFYSPFFILSNTKWRFYFERCGCQMYLELRSKDFETAKILNCRLRICWMDGSVETIVTKIGIAAMFSPSKLIHHHANHKSAGNLRKRCLLFPDTFTFKCHLVIEKEDVLHDKRLKSRETLTEVLNSATDNENVVKCVDLTSSETEDSVIGKETDERHNDSVVAEVNGILTVINNMKELLTNGNDDYDVRIFVGDKKFRAHSIILKARSPVFNKLLTHDSEEKLPGVINIDDCDPDSFDEFLLFVYTGKTENLTPSNAVHLYYTADKYDFTDLKKQCVCYMETSLSTSSVCDAVILAAKYGEEELLEKATEFFTQNIKEVLPTVEWQNFLWTHPIEANELYMKSLVLFNKS